MRQRHYWRALRQLPEILRLAGLCSATTHWAFRASSSSSSLLEDCTMYLAAKACASHQRIYPRLTLCGFCAGDGNQGRTTTRAVYSTMPLFIQYTVGPLGIVTEVCSTGIVFGFAFLACNLLKLWMAAYRARDDVQQILERRRNRKW
jgi:hypothetical protein